MGVPSTMMPVMSAEQRDAENAKAEARKKQKKSLQVCSYITLTYVYVTVSSKARQNLFVVAQIFYT